MIHRFILSTLKNFTLTGFQKLPKIRSVNLYEIDYTPNLYSLFANVDTLESFFLFDVNRYTNINQIFPDIRFIRRDFSIFYNTDLVDISMLEYFPLPHSQHENSRNIIVMSNPKLNCKIDLFCRAVETYPDSIWIVGNGGGCTYESLSEYCSLKKPVYNSIYDTICSNSQYTFRDTLIYDSGKYLDTLTAYNGADSIITLDLLVNHVDSINLDTFICKDEAIMIGNESISEQGIYEFKLQNQYGCDSLVIVDVEVSDMEINTVEIIPDYGCKSGAIKLSIVGNNPPYAFNWSNGYTDKSITELTGGEYGVTISDRSNCKYETESYTVPDSFAYMIPNMFFPGGTKEDINSTFKPYLGRYSKILSIEIFSRWGEKVFYSEDDTPWDGTYKGVQSPPGVYLYKIVIESPCGAETETGQIMLLK
jgi:gliding motility-associated-like protein